ncbi:hypothetical protein H0N95_01610, partial [Candidatus Micrarchaeota archaeon]|nr:hypothetical protein [Candidatus Micrarchaeota archaeon]
IEVLNNGTGTAYLDSSIKIESKEGGVVYGAVIGNTTIQPGETRTVGITKDLDTVDEFTFSIHKETPNLSIGAINYRYRFTC